MPSTVSSKGESSFVLIPPATHYAVCTRVLNLGEQSAGNYGAKPKHFIGFDVPAVRVEWEKDGVKHEGPGFIGIRLTSSLSPKSIMRQHLESWRGCAFTEAELASFDLFRLLGVSAMISVIHTEDGKYANINAIMRMPSGSQEIMPESELLGYDPSSPDANAVFQKLPEGFQKAILRGQQPVAAPPLPPPPTPGLPLPSVVTGPGYGSLSGPPPQRGPLPPPPPIGSLPTGPDGQPRPPVDDDFDSDIPF